MRIRYLLFAALAALYMVSCTKEMYPEEGSGEKMIITALSDATKTSLDGTTVIWSVGDKIVMNGIESNELDAGSIIEGKKARFVFESVIEPDFFAVYPASAYINNSFSNGRATISIPSYQTREGDGFDSRVAIMLAHSNEKVLQFSHSVSYIKLTFNKPVTSIEIAAVGAEMLSGEFETTFNNNLTPVAGKVTGSVCISSDTPVAGPWVIGVPAGEYSGLVISVTDADGNLMVKNTKAIKTVAGTIYNLTSTNPVGFIGNREMYFVKTNGSGDGSSWDNAASFASMVTLINSTDVNGYNVYMAGGTYNSLNGFDSEITLTHSSATKFSIHGGYPADATGTSLGGRDIQNHPTVLDAEGSKRIFVLNGAGIDITLNGLKLINSNHASNFDGTTVVIAKATSALFEDCILEGNSYKVIRTTKPSAWKRCSFLNNHGASVGVADISSETTFENCVFEGNTGSRTGVFQVGAATLISKGNIYRNNVQGVWDGNTCTSTDFGGGAIYLNSGTASVVSEGDEFHENRGGVGGAIAIGFETAGKASTASLTITNAHFKNNRAGRCAGTTGVGGGAIYLNGGTTVITDSQIRENYVTWSNDTYAGGAGILATGSSDLQVSACTFTNNRSASCASAIFCYNGGTGTPVKLRDCIFDGQGQQNAKSRGGALRTSGDNSRIYADRCVFKSHVVRSGYGSVAMTSGGGMAFNNCTFYNNRITDDTGGLYSTIYANSTKLLVIVNCSFWDDPVRNDNPTKTNAVLYYGKDSNPAMLINNLIVNKRASAETDYAIAGVNLTNLTSANNVVSSLGTNFTSKGGFWSGAYNLDFGLGWDSASNMITADGNFGGYVLPASVDYSSVSTTAAAFYNWVGAEGFTVDGRNIVRSGAVVYPGAYQAN